MDLQLTSDQLLLQETTTRFLQDTSPLTKVRELEHNPDGFERDWWERGAELGWTSMLAPEALGGGSISGQALRDLALVAFERGRMVAPGPFVPTNVVVAALGAAATLTADQESWVARLMEGSAVGAIAIEETGGPWGVSGIGTRAEPTADGLVLTGTKAPVEAAAEAEVFVVAAVSDDGPVLVLVPADTEGLTVTRRETIDLVRRFGTVHMEGVVVPSSATLSVGPTAVENLLDIANALSLAETVGALDRVFEFTLEWAFDRHTFGRPLASYQELKHRFADMKLWLEASKATVVAAVTALADGSGAASELVSTAKSYVSEHGPELVQDCVQMHGGIGVTWDHDIHLYLRRVTLNSAIHGTTRDHRERLASMILQGA